MEQTHTNWVSTESLFEALSSLNLEIAPLCRQLQWHVVEVNMSDDHGKTIFLTRTELDFDERD